MRSKGPIAPNLELVVPRELAAGPRARRDAQCEVEEVCRALLCRLGRIARVNIHVLPHKLVPLGRGDDLNRRHEGEVGDRAVARAEVNQVALNYALSYLS